MTDHPPGLEPLHCSPPVDTAGKDSEHRPEGEPEQEVDAQPNAQPETEPTSNSPSKIELSSRTRQVETISTQPCPTPNHNDVRLPGIREVVGEQFLLPKPAPVEPPPIIPPWNHISDLDVFVDNLRVNLYTLAGGFFNMTQPINETKSSHERLTVDHRKIRYTLALVQQPEKARACGSGPRCMFGSLM